MFNRDLNNMTRFKQKVFEKVFTDLLVDCVNKKESKNITFLRYGDEGVETDLIYQDGDDVLGIEIFGHYQSVKKGNKFTLLKLTNLNYSKGQDVVEFLETQIKGKITKKYHPLRKWLVCVNRFPALSAKDFRQIFLSNYQSGWGDFERIFVVFEKYQTKITKQDIFECYEIDKGKSELILMEEKTLLRMKI